MIAEASHAATPSMSPTQLNCRMLVVDNEPSQRFFFRWLLQGAGAEVETAANGLAAIYAVQAADLEARPYDVVLMDLKTSVLDGYATLGAIRRLGYSMPVIAMSTDDHRETVDRCRKAGFDAFADKLHARERLVQVVRNAASSPASRNPRS